MDELFLLEFPILKFHLFWQPVWEQAAESDSELKYFGVN